MRRRRVQPLALIAALIAVAVTTWMQRGETPRASNPAAPPAQRERTVQSERTVPTERPAPAERTASGYDLDRVPEAERAQLRETLRLIDAGGPFPFPKKDGTVFGNRENQLPARSRGYYREYTVPTPGASNRGARRVVQGKDGDTYYTNDHYASFLRIRE